MANIFFISDTHFGHAGILSFKREDGSPLRDFLSVEEMDEHMVERWNSRAAASGVIPSPNSTFPVAKTRTVILGGLVFEYISNAIWLILSTIRSRAVIT